jgi:hypothetical protein
VLDLYRFYVLYLGVKKRKKTMNLETYLETNNRTTADLVNLFSVGAVLDTVSGDTFPMLAGGTIDFDETMNLMDMDISDDSFDWYDSLAWGDKEIVDEVMDDLSYDKYCENNPAFNAAMNGHPEYI